MTYPAYQDAPASRWMTPCQVLCWIGYRRAIPKKLYYAPLTLRQYSSPDDRLAALHAAVPEPKPSIDPIGDAERSLIEKLRSAEISAWFTAEDEQEAEVPTSAYRGAVVVTARGALEQDADASDADTRLTVRPHPFKDLRFLTQGVISVWPSVQTYSARSPQQAEKLSEIAARRRGPKPETSDRVVSEMIRDYDGRPADLAGEKQARLADVYGVVESTARMCRKRALQRFGWNHAN